MAFYRPYYPMIREIKNPNRLIVLYARYLRRVTNPQYTSRFSGEIQSCQFLFDRTDALIHAAIKWGGNGARFAALTARHELGTLRDYRFVLPALESNDDEVRRNALMCLTFIHPPEAFDAITNIAQTDEVEEVRRAATIARNFLENERLEVLEISPVEESMNIGGDNDNRGEM